MAKSAINLVCVVWAAFFLLTIYINTLFEGIHGNNLVASGALLGIGIVAIFINLCIPSDKNQSSDSTR